MIIFCDNYHYFNHASINDDLFHVIIGYLESIDVSINLNELSENDWKDLAIKSFKWINSYRDFVDVLDRNEGAPSKWIPLYYLTLSWLDYISGNHKNLFEMTQAELQNNVDGALEYLANSIKRDLYKDESDIS